MTQEEKELLLKDLCARLPYKVRIKELDPLVELELYLTSVYKESVQVETPGGGIMACDITAIKPYLRPMSSMTEEEEKELSRKYNWDIRGNQISIRYHSEGYWDNETECPTEEYLNLFDWLNAHYFDYRGLISKGLAIEAPEGIYKF